LEVDRDSDKLDVYYLAELKNNGKRFGQRRRELSQEIPEILEESKLRCGQGLRHNQ
jgi:hypothetical protein